jgi:catechol 2,3-dioxygenase-like lactoylglutathione lyase family enzyme
MHVIRRFWIALAVLSVGVSISAVSAQDDVPVMAGANISHVGLNAENLDNLEDWYIKKLGFAIETQGKSLQLGGKRIVYLKLNDLILELVEADKGVAHDPPTKKLVGAYSKPGGAHICLRVSSADIATKELESRGVKIFVPTQTFTLAGTPYERNAAFVMDPEGNVIEIAEAADVVQPDESPPSKKKGKSEQ